MAKQPTFKYDEWRERKQQTYDKDNIFVEKCGKKYNQWQAIQEAREDTEIYPTLEKYGCLDRMTLNAKEAYGDFTEIQKERSIFDQQLKAQKLWERLPLEVRQEFDHNVKNFVDNGEQWLVNKIKEETQPIVENNTTEQPKGE